MSDNLIGLITRLAVTVTTGNLRTEVPPIRLITPLGQPENLNQITKTLLANDVTGTLAAARLLLPEAKKYAFITATGAMKLRIIDADDEVVNLNVGRGWLSDGAVKSIEIFNISTTTSIVVRALIA